MSRFTLGTRPARWIRTTLFLAAAAVPAQATPPGTTAATTPSTPPATAPAKPPATSPHGGAPHAMPSHGMPPGMGQKEPAQKPIPIPLPPTPKGSADLSKARQVKQMSVVVRHRVFAKFAEALDMKQGDDVVIGDTDYSARFVEYVPDFGMDIETGRIFSRTDQPNNPAFKIIIREKGAPTDTTWAFMNLPPHFARKSLLSFQVMRIDYTSGKPLLARVPAGKPTASKAPTGTSGAAR